MKINNKIYSLISIIFNNYIYINKNNFNYNCIYIYTIKGILHRIEKEEVC